MEATTVQNNDPKLFQMGQDIDHERLCLPHMLLKTLALAILMGWNYMVDESLDSFE